MHDPRFPLLMAALLATAGLAVAAPSTAPRAAPAAKVRLVPDTLTPAERGELTRQFVRKWGAEVQRSRGIPVETWAMRSVPLFVKARPEDFRRALARDTLEGALAELMGQGPRVSDADVARLGGAKALGELNRDLVYTPIQPCRVVDTRISAAGHVEGDTPRSFRVVGASSFAAQGGSDTNCGTPATGASAVVLNATIIYPGNAGYATLYPYGSEQPLASSINYPGRTVVSNSVVVGIPNPMDVADITLYSYRGAHFVMDIVGYYRPKTVPTMQCQFAMASTPAPTGLGFSVTAGCPATYSAMGAACIADNAAQVEYDVHGVITDQGNDIGMCAGVNKGQFSTSVNVHTRCCRVAAP